MASLSIFPFARLITSLHIDAMVIFLLPWSVAKPTHSIVIALPFLFHLFLLFQTKHRFFQSHYFCPCCFLFLQAQVRMDAMHASLAEEEKRQEIQGDLETRKLLLL